MPSSISVENLSYRYPKATKQIFSNVSFTIPENAFVAFVAPNGTGKTTMLQLMTGQLPLSSGHMMLQGKSLSEMGEDIFRHVSILTSDMKTPRFLTVGEALRFSLQCYSNHTDEKYNEIIRLFDLDQHQHKQMRQLSSGLERRAELAQTLSNDSSVLLLDEPCNALDFSSVKDTVAAIKKIWEMGKTIVYSTHQFHEIEHICTHIMVIRRDRVMLSSVKEIGMTLSDYYRKAYEVS